MVTICPSCGAIYRNDLTCQSLFDEFLALEFSNPRYWEVHFLTVACFMIQHGEYSQPALVWIEKQLRDFLEAGVSTEQIRGQAAQETSPTERKWHVTRRPEDPPQPKIAWSMTIQDVSSDYRDAESYCRLVKQWARTTLLEMNPLLCL